MSRNAIVLFYTGEKPGTSDIERLADILQTYCYADLTSLTVKHYDEDSIRKTIGEDAIRKIVFEAKESYEQPKGRSIKIDFTGTNKVKVGKFIKDTLHTDLRTAKSMIDNNVVIVPNEFDSGFDVYEFTKGLVDNGATITDTDGAFAVSQAVYFIIRKGYIKIDVLVKDHAIALYHSRVNCADENEKALINAMSIITENYDIAKYLLTKDVIDTIVMLTNG